MCSLLCVPRSQSYQLTGCLTSHVTFLLPGYLDSALAPEVSHHMGSCLCVGPGWCHHFRESIADGNPQSRDDSACSEHVMIPHVSQDAVEALSEETSLF